MSIHARELTKIVQNICKDMPDELATIVSELAIHAEAEAHKTLLRITNTAEPTVGMIALIVAMQLMKAALENEIKGMSEILRTKL